jgi:hypothetical protein
VSRLAVAVKVTATREHRQWRPSAGDHVRWPGRDSLGRIWTIGGEAGSLLDAGEAHVCVTQGSAFLGDDGSVSISGGPFVVVKVLELVDSLDVQASWFWNWGDSLPGRDMGVSFALPRPVWSYTGEVSS